MDKVAASKFETFPTSRLLDVGISRCANADNPDNAIVPDGIVNRLRWDPSQFDVLGG